MEDYSSASLFHAIIGQFSYLHSDSHVLDFGCGNGSLVCALRARGIKAVGCDFVNKEDISDFTTNVQQAFLPGVLKPIEMPYRLPYEDNCFDYVISNQVFEHVMDYRLALSEIYRVLKPGGYGIHLFPSRYVLIEPHVFVPLASVLQRKSWLLLWAGLGIRNDYQKHLSSLEVAARNQTYLLKHTHYPPCERILEHCSEYSTASFREDIYLKALNNRKGKIARVLWRGFPWLPLLVRHFHTRLLIAKK